MLSENLALRFSFIVALVATFGSLYFGEILKYPPCTLCWYQRICMYPLVIIFGSTIWTEERNFLKNSLPLSVVGLIIASYHNLLYYGWIEDSIKPCSLGISCTTKQVEILGFITIPLMSWISFAILVLLGVVAAINVGRNYEKK